MLIYKSKLYYIFIIYVVINVKGTGTSNLIFDIREKKVFGTLEGNLSDYIIQFEIEEIYIGLLQINVIIVFIEKKKKK